MKTRMGKWIFLAGTALVSIVFVTIVVVGIINFNRDMEEKQLETVVQAVEQTVALCYALEGSYPPDLSYLQKNYGLILNENRYIYDYRVFASNIKPQIAIFKK